MRGTESLHKGTNIERRKGMNTLRVDETSVRYCKLASRAVDLLRHKWTVQILYAMRIEPVRLSQLKRIIPLASKKAIIASLRSLEADRIVVRRDLSNSVLHVEYDFERGMREAIVPLLDSLVSWGNFCERKASGTNEAAG